MTAKMITVHVFTLITAFFSISFSGQYTPTELFMVPWGSGPEKLRISMPTYEDVNFTPEDSSDDFIDTGGPKQGVVDLLENVYIASHRFMQLKGFGKDGHLVFDYSKGEPAYNAELFRTALRSINVDSASRIYVVDGMRYSYVAVVDTAGHLLDKLSPYGQGSGVVVAAIFPNSNDALTICCKNRTFHTYEHGNISPGGGSCWRAEDGYYYYIRLEDSTHVTFVRYSNPDIHGSAADLQENMAAISGPSPSQSEFLGVDSEMRLYVYLVGASLMGGRVLIYDTSFNVVDEISLPEGQNKYQWYMRPFMRPRDGNIYEFRCLDDGLHVIRWSRQ